MRAISTLQPVPLTDTDRKQVRKDFYYAAFKKGVTWTSAITGAMLLLWLLIMYRYQKY
jgi:hypothetical protein